MSAPAKTGAGEDRHATWLELFFDLVFVIAVAKLSARLGENLGWRGLIEFLALFIPIWWIWVGHTIYTTRYDRDTAFQRWLTFGQMLAVAAMALHVERGLLGAKVGFATCFVVARICLLILYAGTHIQHPSARPVTTMVLIGYGAGGICWLVSIAVDPQLCFALWGLGIFIDLVSPAIARRFAQLPPVDTSHMPERFGLFVIIVLGETVLAVVNGIGHVDWTLQSVLACGLGFGLAMGIWWMYFSYTTRATFVCTLGTGRAYIFLHLPMVLAIVTIGLGVEEAIQETGHAAENHVWMHFLYGAVTIWLLSFLALQVTTLPPLQTKHLKISFGLALVVVAALWLIGAHLRPPFVLLALTGSLGILTVFEAKFIRRVANRMAGQSSGAGKTKLKEYLGGSFAVTFDPMVCIHSGECLRNLPAVFDVSKRPWVRTDQASAETIADVVALCPTGALQFKPLEYGSQAPSDQEREEDSRA